MISPPYIPGTPCPCECGATGAKLNRFGHVARFCKCRSCLGRNNRKRGKANERARHLALGGSGFTPADDLPHMYSVPVMTEDKLRRVTPASLAAFLDSAFYGHAMYQVQKKIPVGVDAHPALYFKGKGRRAILIVEVEL